MSQRQNNQDAAPGVKSHATYKTSDLNLAAYLKARHRLNLYESGLENSGLEKKDHRVFFTFSTKDVDIIQLINNYINAKDDLCSINAFIRELNTLKILIRNLFENR